MKIISSSTIACLFSALMASAAYADDCSGRDHTTGTVLGAAGGAAIAGAVVGGLAGNAIARAQDCDRSSYDSRRNYDQRDDRSQVGYYGPQYNVAPDENDYWGVESYEDFGADYRHISDSIQRARARGSLSPSQARRFNQKLRQIQVRADWQQRHGRFDAGNVEAQLTQLRYDMRSTRRNSGNEQGGDYFNRR
jgi:hypothetical protein